MNDDVKSTIILAAGIMSAWTSPAWILFILASIF
jgi:membrane glycosyltransferase